MQKKCESCGFEFESKRGGKYCSNACKAKYYRRNNLADNLSTVPIGATYSRVTNNIADNLTKHFLPPPRSTVESFPYVVVCGGTGGIAGGVWHYKTQHKRKDYKIMDTLKVAGLGVIGGAVLGAAIEKLIDYGKSYFEEQTVAPVELLPINEASLSDNGAVYTPHQLLHTYSHTFRIGGIWDDFLGTQLNNNFFQIVYGAPGAGKSHFGMMEASALAKSGKLLYVLAEESATNNHVKERIAKYNMPESVEIMDTRSSQAILEKLRTNQYQFVVIDSLNGLDLHFNNHVSFVKQLKGLNLTGIVALLQVNKDGTYTGKNELLHECDTEIEVSEGIATTLKNRFGDGQPKTLSIFGNSKIKAMPINKLGYKQ